MFTEQHIRTTAKMYDMREVAKRFLGTKYDETMKTCREILERDAARNNDDTFHALIRQMTKAQQHHDSGFACIYLMAAFVELTENPA